jgi:hypothetical protein
LFQSGFHATDFAAAVSEADVVLGTVGGDYPARSLRRFAGAV